MKNLLQCCAPLLCLLTLACMGMGARSDALQIISITFDTIVHPAVSVGIGAEQDAGRLSEANANMARAALDDIGRLLRGESMAPATVEEALERILPIASAGIDARVARGEIGPGVGAALKESLRQFSKRLIQVVTPAPVPADTANG